MHGSVSHEGRAATSIACVPVLAKYQQAQLLFLHAEGMRAAAQQAACHDAHTVEMAPGRPNCQGRASAQHMHRNSTQHRAQLIIAGSAPPAAPWLALPHPCRTTTHPGTAGAAQPQRSWPAATPVALAQRPRWLRRRRRWRVHRLPPPLLMPGRLRLLQQRQHLPMHPAAQGRLQCCRAAQRPPRSLQRAGREVRGGQKQAWWFAYRQSKGSLWQCCSMLCDEGMEVDLSHSLTACSACSCHAANLVP